jgi:ABC-type antimicrobial peptide transport system, permease component
MISLYKKTVIMLKLMYESISFALASLKGDKFRTFLSLFGVSIGIFSIVTVFTVVDAMRANVSSGLSAFGSDVVYIQKFFPDFEEGETEFKFWEYMSRPNITYDEFLFLKANAKNSEAIVFATNASLMIKYKRNSLSNAYVYAHTYEWDKVSSFELESGRYFSAYEMQSSIPAVILGSSVAETLFQGEDPLNKTIKVGKSNVVVIGVMKFEGESMVSIIDNDNSILVPYTFAGNLFDVKRSDGFMIASPKVNANREDFLQELRQIMRAIRRLPPKEKDSFSIVQMTFLLDMVDDIFSGIAMAGWIIGGFSILIGGFGIANIMFVSVKERTNLIGIQKSLGAKKYVILTQFLTEAAFLALAGGAVGLLIVQLAVIIIGGSGQFPITLSLGNILQGLMISSVIGIVAGFVPARNAANLNPVEAINSK